MLTKAENNILLFHIVRSAKVFTEFCSKTNSTTFDPAIWYAHDFVAGVLGDVWKEHHDYVGAVNLRSILEDRLDRQSYDEGVKADIRSTIANVYTVPDTELNPKLGLSILKKVIDTQITHKAKRELDELLLTGGSVAAMMARVSRDIASKTIGVQSSMLVRPFADPRRFMMTNATWPLGIPFIDTILNGGITSHEIIGLLAPSGGGKTTVAVQATASYVRQSEMHHSLMFTYEQPIMGDIMTRMCTSMTGIDVSQFRGRNYEELDDVSRMKLSAATEKLDQRFIMADFSVSERGSRGLEDIKAAIEEVNPPESGPPLLVIIDWFLPCLQRYMASKGTSASEKDAIRRNGLEFINSLKDYKNSRNVTFMITHQLNPTAANASPNRVPQWGDAAEWKGFAWEMDICFAIGRMSEEKVAWFTTSKVRTAAVDKRLIKLKGEFCRFDDANDNYMMSHGKVVPKVNEMENLDDLVRRKPATMPARGAARV